MNIQSICTKCGGDLVSIAEGTFKCRFCGATYKEDTIKKEIEALSFLLDENKREKVAILKQNLWKKTKEEYNDSEEIIRICREIKSYSPEDFYANFYEYANLEQEDNFIEFLKNMDVSEHFSEMEDVILYSIKSITPKNMSAICDLIEKAFKNNDLSLYNEYRTKLDAEAMKINDCVFDPAYPRNVFICYSSKDMDSVESLVRYLEEQGLLCFVAMRNLQHGRGAVQNYWKAIHTAIENCECIVFLSSTNSRSINCDALQELRYVNELEQKLGKKIKKIEYLLENYVGSPVERTFKKIFEGLEYCYDIDTVFDRIISVEEAEIPDKQPVIEIVKSVKYCSNCGKENPENAKFCFACGKDEFVCSIEEFIQHANSVAREEAAAGVQKEEIRRGSTVNNGKEDDYFSGNMTFVEVPTSENHQYNESSRSRGTHNSNNVKDDYFSGNMTYVDVNIPNIEEDNYFSNNKNKNRHQQNSSICGEITEVIKGQHIILPSGIRNVSIEMSSTYKVDDVSADLYVFLLDHNEKVLSESDLIFFGNDKSLNKSVILENMLYSDRVDINLRKVNQDIEKIRFILSFNREDGKVRNFSMLERTNVTITVDDNVYVFQMENVGRFESVSVFEFYRIRDTWRLKIQEAGLNAEIGQLCNDYGIEVEQ